MIHSIHCASKCKNTEPSYASFSLIVGGILNITPLVIGILAITKQFNIQPSTANYICIGGSSASGALLIIEICLYAKYRNKCCLSSRETSDSDNHASLSSSMAGNEVMETTLPLGESSLPTLSSLPIEGLASPRVIETYLQKITALETWFSSKENPITDLLMKGETIAFLSFIKNHLTLMKTTEVNQDYLKMVITSVRLLEDQKKMQRKSIKCTE